MNCPSILKNCVALCLASFSICAFADGKASTEGFENGFQGWALDKPGKALVSGERASEGAKSLRLDPPVKIERTFKVEAGAKYILKFNSFAQKYGQFYVNVDELDANGKVLNPSPCGSTSDTLLAANRKERHFWLPVEVPFDVSAHGRSIKLSISARGSESLWIDELSLVQVKEREYLKAEEMEAANSADGRLGVALKGPDGLLYPNFSFAGLSDEKAFPERIVALRDFGGLPDDGKDDSDALDAAMEKAAASGGAIVKLEPGVYNISRKIAVDKDGIVIKGAGRDRTRVLFGLPANQVGLYPDVYGDRMRNGATLEVFFKAEGAKSATLLLDGKELKSWKDAKAFEKLPDAPAFAKIAVKAKELLDRFEDGRHKVEAAISYADGTVKNSTVSLLFDPASNQGCGYASSAISFLGPSTPKKAESIALAESARRGDLALALEKEPDFKPGELILLSAPRTERWSKLIHNTCTWGRYRDFVAAVEKVDGKTLTLKQPLRIDFPLEDEPSVVRFPTLKDCGIEDLRIEQAGEIQIELKMAGVMFFNASNCRAERVDVERPGTRGIFGSKLKNCVIRDCKFKDPWRTKFGGLAYGGFENSWDCLMERVETWGMRHAPILNWTCSGNVIRDSRFHQSDAQWHSGWCNENLYENCLVEAVGETRGSYGFGLFSTPVDDSMHGPNGPRNVVYGCVVKGVKGGACLGGMNQQWMLMYNSFEVESGPGVIERFGCRDNIIQGNVFSLKSAAFPLLYCEFSDNVGGVLKNNVLYGGDGALFAGPGKPSTVEGNSVKPYMAGPAKPKAPASSLYEWQLERFARLK